MKFIRRGGLLAGAVALALAGCGGGGGGDSNTNTNTNTNPAGGLTLSGTAATGAALASATVTAKCASGGGSGTVAANGHFSIGLGANAALPCVLRAVGGSTVLHGAVNSGSVANVTPLTELALARAAGGSAAALFDNFDAAAQAKLGADSLNAALQALGAALQGRVNLGGDNPFTVAFNIDDAHDRRLDSLQDLLTRAHTSLATLASALSASGGTPGTVGTLLQASSASCTGLRSGRYRLLDPNVSTGGGTLLQVDAAAPAVTLPNGTVVPLTDEGQCSFRFTDVAGTGRVLVSPSGVGVLRRQRVASAPGQTDVSVVLPEQSLPLAELAGTWNMLSFEGGPGGLLSTSLGTFSFTAAGVLTPKLDCVGLICATLPSSVESLSVRANADAGFTISVGGRDVVQAFAMKTADGHLALVGQLADGAGVFVATRQQAAALPAVGSVSKFWDFSVSPTGVAGTLNSSEVTVTAVDTATQTVTRQRSSDGRVDFQHYNAPLPGTRNRVRNSCQRDGAAFNCDGTLTLPLPGTGVSVYAGLSPASYLGISINQP